MWFCCNLLLLFTISAHLYSASFVNYIKSLAHSGVHMENESNSPIKTGFHEERESLSFFAMNLKMQFQCRCRCFSFFIKNYNHFILLIREFLWKLVIDETEVFYFWFPLYLFYFHLQILSLVCVGLTLAEPPTSYLPPQVSTSYGPPASGLAIGHGNGYHAVGSGYQESEGAHLDPQLLHKIEQILLDEENHHKGGREYLIISYKHFVLRTKSINWYQKLLLFMSLFYVH